MKLVFLASHIEPVLGMERVLLSLYTSLKADFGEDLGLVVLGSSEASADKSVVSLGKKLSGYRRIFAIPRILRNRRAWENSTIILVGVWAAVPVLLIPPRKCKIIVWEHSLLKENILRSRNLRLLSILAKQLYKRADRVITVSSPLQSDLAELGIESSVIANQVDQIDFELADTTERIPFALCSVGSLTKVKDHAFLIEVMKHLDDRYCLKIAGNGPEFPALQRKINSEGLNSRIHLLGHLEHADALTLIRESTALVHSSHGETFGLIFAESLQLGTPVIAVDNRAVQDWISNNADVTSSSRSAKEMAEKIRFRIETSKEIRTRLPDTYSKEQVLGAWKEALDDPE